jgi:hypothetical protein
MIVLFNMKIWPLWARKKSCFTALLDIDRRVISQWLGWTNGERLRAWIRSRTATLFARELEMDTWHVHE